MSTETAVGWERWLERWEAQQGGYMEDREERFAAMVDAVAGCCGPQPRVVDLGCGPGSLARRLLDAVPGASVVAVDMDPVLLAIGRGALGDMGGRLQWVDADLRSGWEQQLDGPVDACVSTTALHWLQASALEDLYGVLGRVTKPGGVFLNGDRLDFGPETPQIAMAAQAIRDRGRASDTPPSETWEQWWDAVAVAPELAEEIAERRRRHHDHPERELTPDLAFHRRALREAGFAEVDTIWQHLADRVLMAVR